MVEISVLRFVGVDMESKFERGAASFGMSMKGDRCSK